MRVLTVGNIYPPHHLGGYELVWQGAVRTLRDAGHAVRVLTTDVRYAGVASHEEDGTSTATGAGTGATAPTAPGAAPSPQGVDTAIDALRRLPPRGDAPGRELRLAAPPQFARSRGSTKILPNVVARGQHP